MGTQISLTAVCAVLPFLLLLRYYYRSDLFREPRGNLVRTFLLGLVVMIPAAFVELGLAAVPVRALGPMPAAFYSAFVVAAIPEEALKLFVIGRYCARLPDFSEPMDGIVYGATVGLGFAALENAIYVLGGGLLVAILRGVTSVPLHATCGAVLGYYVARGRLEQRRGSVLTGLAIAVIIHGLYDFGPMAYLELARLETQLPHEGPIFLGLAALFLVVLVSSWLGMRRLIRRLHAEQLRSASRAGRSNEAEGAGDGTPPAGAADGSPIAPEEGRTGSPPSDETASGSGRA